MNTDRLVSTFCDFVKIPSVSPDEREFISYLEKLFKEEGGKTTLDSFGNLIVKFDAKNSKSTEPVAFCCHADTVKPGTGIEPVIENGIIRSKGDTILGADDKAGIAEILEMIRCVEKHPPIEVIITRSEEPGSFGAVNLDYSLVKSKMAYVLDMDAPEEITVGGPTKVNLDVYYKGKPAHAGIAPEKGISAIQTAAKAISQLKLGKLDDESTANVGVIEGGEIRNGVPEHTNLQAECRCLNHEKALKIAEEMETIFNNAAKEFGADVNIKMEITLKAYSLSPDSPVVKLAMEALSKHGIKAKTKVTRGGTDATQFNARGIQTAVLGVGSREIHSCNEYAIIEEMETMTKAIRTLVEDLA